MIIDFFNLIFPKLCNACSEPLLKGEKVVCTKCLTTLPKTNFHLDNQNSVFKVFWGRTDIKMAASFYYFSKKGKVQQLLHGLKYKGAKEIGQFIGKIYGFELKQSPYFKKIDFIIPVPLHPKKFKKRGYNQSEYFAQGLSNTMNISVNTNCLIRNMNSETQTKKSRYNRWENVGEIFEIKDEQTIKNKSVLLVDDVITTGATIEACAKVLSEKGCKVYIASIACA